MSGTINETRSCGATFEYRGDYAMTAAGAFRKAHAECRKKPNAVASAIHRTDKYRLQVHGVSVTANEDQERRIRAMDDEAAQRFAQIMGREATDG